MDKPPLGNTDNKPPPEKTDEVPLQKIDEGPLQKIDEKILQKKDEEPSQKIDEGPSQKTDEGPSQRIDEEPFQKINEEPLQKINEEPLQKINEESLQKIDEEPLQKINEEPLQKINEEPLQKINEEPLQKINEEPLQKIDEEPLQKIDEEPLQKINEEPLQKIDEGSLLKKGEGPLQKTNEDALQKLDQVPLKESNKKPLKPTVKSEAVVVKNEVVKEEVIKDEMIFEEEDSPLETVLNFSSESPSEPLPANNNNSSACVNVPFTLITEKDKEIEQLKRDLEGERKLRKAAEEKVGKLVEFITFLHGQFGKLITSLVSLTTKSAIIQNTLTVGPFTDDKETNEFLDMLKGLSSQFQNELKNLASTKNLLERANLMLKIKPSENNTEKVGNEDKVRENESTTASSSSNIDLDPDLCALIGLIPCGTSLTTVPLPKTRRRLSHAGVKSVDFRTPKPKSFSGQGQAHGVDYSKRHWGFVCLCGSKYASKSNLNFHIKHFTAERKLECDICKKQFLVASQLKKHLSFAHNDALSAIAASPVPVQSRTGFQKFMQHHQNYNANVAHALPPVPNLSVPQVTIQPVSNRQNHVMNPTVVNSNPKTHGEDPTFINRCLCGKVYKQKQTLTVHIATQMNGKVFKCSMCPQRFTLPRSLKKHYLKAHSKNNDQATRKFECKDCRATYPTKESLMVHCSIIHRNQGHNVTLTPVNPLNTLSDPSRALPNHSRRLPPPPGLISLYSSSNYNASVSGRGSNFINVPPVTGPNFSSVHVRKSNFGSVPLRGSSFSSIPTRESSMDFTAVEDDDGVICID